MYMGQYDYNAHETIKKAKIYYIQRLQSFYAHFYENLKDYKAIRNTITEVDTKSIGNTEEIREQCDW